MDDVSKENAVLRHKISVMDGIITSLRRELSTVKAALGPWYRPDRRAVAGYRIAASLASATHIASSPRNEDTTGTSDGTTHNGDATVPAHPSVSTGSFGNADDLSSYFPEPEPDDWLPADYRSQSHEAITQTPSSYSTASSSHPVQQQTAHTASTIRSNVLPHVSYAQTQYSAYAGVSPVSPSQSPVAPLDISTSLEGSLHGLRESIVTLSGALDSLGRRQDIALTTESTRTAEEIRSLRAILHGLRMQVKCSIHVLETCICTELHH